MLGQLESASSQMASVKPALLCPRGCHAVPQEASPACSHGSREGFLERVDGRWQDLLRLKLRSGVMSLVAVRVNCKAGPGSRDGQMKFIAWWGELQVSKLIALFLLRTLGKSRLIH